ncbi:HAD-IB family phosphatase [Nanoarchaeota archaeon]
MNYKLIVFDMDGVIFHGTNFWTRVHEAFGTLEQGKVLTKKYLHTDYAKLVEEVVNKLWKGRDATPYFNLIQSLTYMDGIQDLFKVIKNKDLITMIISASSIDVARRAQKDLGFDHIFANELVIQNNKITGEFLWPIAAGFEKKVEIIEHMCQDLGINLDEVIYIGDAEPDIEAFKIVGKSIAFNSKVKELKNVATHVVESNDLRDVIPLIE